MRIIDGYRPQKLQVWFASLSPSHRDWLVLKYWVATVPDESSPSPPSEITSPLPMIVADGYQAPEDMSLTREYELVAGSKMYEFFSPSYPWLPSAAGYALFPPMISTRPSGSCT